MSDFWRYFFLGLAVYYGLLIPYNLYRTVRWQRCVRVKEQELTDFPVVVERDFRPQLETLTTLGYGIEVCQCWSYATEESFVFEVRLIHATEQTRVTLTAIQGSDRRETPLFLMRFYGEWQEGRSVEVINSTHYALWNAEPGDTTYIFDGVCDIAVLHSLHLFALQQEEKRMPQIRRVVRRASLEERLAASHALYTHQVRTGILRYDPEAEVYRPTLRGAYRLMFFTCWPFSAIVQEQLREQAQALRRAWKDALSEVGARSKG